MRITRVETSKRRADGCDGLVLRSGTGRGLVGWVEASRRDAYRGAPRVDPAHGPASDDTPDQAGEKARAAEPGSPQKLPSPAAWCSLDEARVATDTAAPFLCGRDR